MKSSTIKNILKKVTTKSIKNPVEPVIENKAVKKPASKAAPKKVAKKTVVKKAPAKKASDKETVHLKKLVTANDKHSFWMNDGQILNNLVALKNALKKMENKVYTYHTNNGRHDFANWVEDVLHDKPLAEALRKTKTPKSAYTLLEKHLRLYQF